jgi:UDP-N-acetylmuramyl pentapeptide phosphotransferase/UDP-N-acetylglucosamine-1-phosphate transferase/glycosyltransferase involved in cell wall biosynthesis
MDLMPLFAFALAAGVTAALVPLTIALANRLGVLDCPDTRKIHKAPTPRLAGIAIIAGMIIAGTFASLYLLAREQMLPPQVKLEVLAIAGAGLFVFVVGLVDDLRSVSSRFKLLTLISASLMVCGAGATFGEVVLIGRDPLRLEWFGTIATVIWIITIAVSMNFIDGLDGLAGGISLLAAGVLAFFLLSSGNVAAAIIPIVVVGALAGFLPFNWHPARTFMGDAGSLTIGFVLATTMVMANPLIGTMRAVVVPALALSVPLTDTCLTLFRRHYQQRRSIFSAERGHIHHRLLDRGISHRHAVLTIYGVSLAAVAIGMVSLQFEGIGTIGGLSLVVPLMWGAFRLAGSIRTSEMITALKQKRDIDRRSRHFKDSFESLQLEFNRVEDFSSWWQGICRAADRLEFVSVSLTVTSRDKSVRTLSWTSTDERFQDCTKLAANIPIADRRTGFPPLEAKVEIAAVSSLESAGERLALFSRLMQEHSLAAINRRLLATAAECKSHNNITVALQRDPGKFLPADQRGPFSDLRVAIVHDFLYTYAGAERVVEQLVNLFPHSDMFALFDFLPEKDRHFLKGKSVNTTFLQHMPLMRRKHRAYLPLMPLSIEQLDMSSYDLIVSSSYLAAKGVITGPDQLHICYCHSPTRYAWDLQHQYLNESRLGYGLKGLAARAILHYIRNWDARTALGVDHFIANSHFVARRIEKLYRREATVIHPPVDTEYYVPSANHRGNYYFAVSRMVPYKRMDLIVAAFNAMPDRELIVIGDGPDFEKVRRNAGPNIKMLGHQDNDTLRQYMQHAKALIFAAEEDFGIVPVEAMACGTPVIAYGKGGVTETVASCRHGVLFDSQTTDSLIGAVKNFEAGDFGDELVKASIRKHAERFAENRFMLRMTEKIGQWVVQKWPDRIYGIKEDSLLTAEAKISRKPLSIAVDGELLITPAAT